MSGQVGSGRVRGGEPYLRSEHLGVGVRTEDVAVVEAVHGHAMTGHLEQRAQQGRGGHLVHEAGERPQLGHRAQMRRLDLLHKATLCRVTCTRVGSG